MVWFPWMTQPISKNGCDRMKMQVNENLCIGCGACAPVCPVDAIHMENGLAVIDQGACTQCQTCVEACPQGAIAIVEVPALAAKPASTLPAEQAKVIVVEPVSSNEKSWLTTVLAFAGQEIFPRLADALVASLERRLAHDQPVKSQTKTLEPPRAQNGMGEHRRQRRAGYGRRLRRQARGRGVGRGKWL
jgi:Fe-S-cluster-containing hydrogenase component 2